MTDLRNKFNRLFADDALLRSTSLVQMQQALDLKIEELPANFKNALGKRAWAHLSVISDFSISGSAAVKDFVSGGGMHYV